jgi:hypothetical protein
MAKEVQSPKSKEVPKIMKLSSSRITLFSGMTQLTHLSDPSNPNKFRKYGGGVLTAVRSDIEASVKCLSMRKGAEIISVEL